jgi:thiol reductant ABC exporter CydD subunit
VKPIDPRLLRYARAIRSYLVLTVILGLATTLLIIAQAYLLSRTIAPAFLEHKTLQALGGLVAMLAVVVVFRALIAWAGETSAVRSSAKAKSQLRAELIQHAADLGPHGLGVSTGELASLTTRGIDALDAYFARYLPQLVLAVIAPITIGIVILGADWLSAVVIAITLPLIPVFMILIGWYTSAQVDKSWRTLGLLSGHFLDVVAGLPTLLVFGRAKAQAVQIRDVTDQYRRASMRVLRVSFLSSFVLEILAMLGVALIAVSIGLRLDAGHVTYKTALLVLVLAPDVYLPLRLVGVHFHAAADGLGAANRIFTVLETPVPERGNDAVPNLVNTTLVLAGVTVRYPERSGPALSNLTLRIPPGRTLGIIGPSGAGKTTLLALLVGSLLPTDGKVLVEQSDGATTDLRQVNLDAWLQSIAWLPQEPLLITGTVADNVRLGNAVSSDVEVIEALRDAGLELAELPNGLATEIRESGAGISTGQRRRVALARTFLSSAPIVFLDEPTAGLDGDAEAAVIAGLKRRLAGRTAVMVLHRPTALAAADDLVLLDAAPDDVIDESVAVGGGAA